MIKSIRCILIFMFFTIFIHAQSNIKILSWNIGMLPYIEQIKNKTDRIVSISNALDKQKYDILIFQESFTNRSRDIIKEKLHDRYPYSYGPINSTFKFNSGLWILSSIPLQLQKEIVFKNSNGLDFLARKGAALFTGEFNNIQFQLIVTHLEDDKYPQSVRNKQMNQIYTQLIIPYSNKKIPQIICGDFNTDQDSENYNCMISELDAQNEVLKNCYTFADQFNDVYKNINPRIIDYVLIRNSNNIQCIDRHVVILKNKWSKGFYLSDHNALEATILFNINDNIVQKINKYEN